MSLIGIALAAAIWLPLMGLGRIWTVRLMDRGRISPRTASLLMAVATASLPWILQLTGAVRPDPVTALLFSIVIAVTAYLTFPAVARLLRPE